MTAAPFDPESRCALVVAHPGHELRLHHWLSTVRPVVSVLTDGSGGAAGSRIEHTTRVLSDVDARPGPVYAELTDRQAYAWLMEGRIDAWEALTARLADGLVEADVTDVVYDGAEGFNPVHDVCNLMASAAARRAGRRLGRALRAWDFPLEAAPDACDEALLPRAVTYALDEASFGAKLEAIARYAPLAAEAERAFEMHGHRAFALERLRPATRGQLERAPDDPPPDYEVIGRERVATGRYTTVLLYEEHVRPLVRALDAHDATPDSTSGATGRPTGRA